MNLLKARHRRPAVLAATSLLLGAMALMPDTTSAQVGDPIDPATCFGAYLNLPTVIHAQPWPTLTWGTGGDDVIVGGDAGEHIYGLGGNDRICSGGGADRVEGGLLTGAGINDDDQIDGGAGADVLHGGIGNDTIYGGVNPPNANQSPFYHDFLYGEDGNDRLYGEGGPDIMDCGPGTWESSDGGTGMLDGSPEADTDLGTCQFRTNLP